MHPLISRFPTWTISVSMPSSAKIFSISLNAMAVLPCTWGLPLIINTFISFSSFSLWMYFKNLSCICHCGRLADWLIG